ncbi:MAG: hypothetical protein ACREOW_15285 [Thermodesulfobacteriota bacterium]
MPYFMIPRFIRFVSSLPKTGTERVQKNKLRRIVWKKGQVSTFDIRVRIEMNFCNGKVVEDIRYNLSETLAKLYGF